MRAVSVFAVLGRSHRARAAGRLGPLALCVVLALLASGCASARPRARVEMMTTPSISDNAARRLSGAPSPTATPALPKPGDKSQEERFVTAVFNDAQHEWANLFEKAGEHYTPAKLVLFTSNVQTGCGRESTKVGPFYCSADGTVYVDVAFFTEMQRRFAVKGDFAQAYVVAHELGHHIQNLTGVTADVERAAEARPDLANELSVRVELQADCYAGVWAHSTFERGLLQPGDLGEALHAAAAVGDDFQQRSRHGKVNREKWTHGSSAQRQHWLRVGYDSGKPSSCDTFAS
jgi:predicted metalloprotease